MNAARILRQPILTENRRVLDCQASRKASAPEAASPAPTASPDPGGNFSPVQLAHSNLSGQAAPQAPTSQASFDNGHAEGLRQGLADAQARVEREIESRWQAQYVHLEQAERRRAEEHQHRIATLDRLLETIDKAMPERFMALERQAIALAYEALCKLCGPQVDKASTADRPSLLADLLRQGVHQLRGQTWLGVRLNPRDLHALMDHEIGVSLSARYPRVRFIADESLEPMAVLIETDHGQLDAGLATQLAQLRTLWAQAA